MSQRGERPRGRSLAPVILSVGAAALFFVAISVVLFDDPSRSEASLFLDIYELTGSRITGLISVVGVVALAVTAGICVFAGKVTWTLPEANPWSRWLLGAGLLTGVLAIDDYLSVHELADDLLASVTGVEAEGALKNALEGGVLGVYGLLFALLLLRFRSTVASSEWTLLAIALSLLLASIGLDLGPHSWLAATFGPSLETQDLVEDTLKLMGIAFYATYFIRVSEMAVRSSAR